VDAAITFEPHLSQTRSLLGNSTVEWQAQADQFGYFEAICTQPWVKENPDLVARFLKSLVQAENLNFAHQDQAIAIVANVLNESTAYVASVWPDYHYSVTLDQSFILLIQDQARWLMVNNMTRATTVPNFLNYVYADGLRTVKPESVNIIGLGETK
jgi:ABC-type nitrate/sulfonate/bicarbonate transport system substrate-binding protein